MCSSLRLLFEVQNFHEMLGDDGRFFFRYHELLTATGCLKIIGLAVVAGVISHKRSFFVYPR